MQEIFNDSEPLKDRLLRNGFRMYFLSFIIAPAWYLIKLMVSRELSVEDVGLVYSIIGFIGLLSAFNDLGLTEALQYYLPHYIIDKEYGKAKTILVITWIVQFIGWIIIWWWLYFAAPRMAEHYFHSTQATDILRLFCFYFLFINLFQVLSSVFTALQNIKLQYITEAVRMWSIVIFVGYSYVYGSLNTLNLSWYRILWVAIGLLVATISFLNIYTWLYSGPLQFERDLFKKQRSYARKIMIWMQAWMIYSNIWQQFAIYYLGANAAGIRSNYMTFFVWIGTLIWPILGYLFPLLTELYKKNDIIKITIIKKYLIVWLCLSSLAIALGGRFFSERAAIFLFKEKFLISWSLFKRTSLCYGLFISSSILFSLLAWAWLIKERVKIIGFGTVFGLILSYIWVKTAWLRWLAAANIAIHLYFSIHSIYYIKKHHL